MNGIRLTCFRICDRAERSAKGDRRQQESIFHEAGHHIEYPLPQEFGELGFHFVTQKADGQARKSLRELTGNEGYEESEKAYPGTFVHPYVGKVYPDGTTEVLSMGLEHFTSADRMRRLYEADPDHFAFMLGMFKAMKERRQ